jgi:ubiquinone biosynthesis protein
MNVVNAVRDLVRLREIGLVLARHGFGEVVQRLGIGRAPKSAPQEGAESAPELSEGDVAQGEQERATISPYVRLRLVLEDLGPSFIKLGQIVSTRGDILPAALVVELKKLQDSVPPVPFEGIKQQVETSLGRSIEEVYLTFDEKPLATASIGQVHLATIQGPNGPEEVVVKVQRPGIAPTIARDLDILHILAAALERAIPETRIYSPVGLVKQFDQSITSELNFLVEADNGERFAQNFSGNDLVRFPRVYREATTRQVLTLEFFKGRKIDKAVADGFDGALIAKRATGVVIKMIFEDGFFHADPHPGNIFILGTPESPIIGLIDVGMVGRLSPELRERTIDLMIAAVRNDPYAVADALYEIGRPTQKVDMREYRGYVATLAEKYLGKPIAQIEVAALIGDLVHGALKYGIEIPTDFMLVGKALMTIEGIGKQLDPNLDIMGEAAPHFASLLKRRYSPQRLGNDLWRTVEQISRAGAGMPIQLREVLDDLRLGRTSVHVALEDLPSLADRLGRRLFSGVVVASLILSGALMLTRPGRETHAYVFFGFAAFGWAIHWLRDGDKKKRS